MNDNMFTFPDDLVQVVRCKDCQHSFILGDSPLYSEPPYKYYRADCCMCGCESLIGDEPVAVYNHFFCGYGERRTT